MEEEILNFLKTADPKQIKPFLDSKLSQDFDSYEELLCFLEKCQPKLSCNANWLSERLIASCKNCGLFDNSCICISCLLDGNHIPEKHQIFLAFGESGSCDCGQSQLWNPKGFCKKHHGQHGNPEEYLPIHLRENFNLIFNALKKFIISEIEKRTFCFFQEIFDFIDILAELGDGVRRLSSISFSEENFLQAILTNCYDFTSKEIDIISTFISSYVNDESFCLRFAQIVLPYSKVLIQRSFESCHVQSDISHLPPLIGPSSILQLIFHVFQEFILRENIINFSQFFTESLELSFDFIHSNPSLFESINGTQFYHPLWIIKLVLQFYDRNNLKDKGNELLIQISSVFASAEGYIPPIKLINQLDDNTSYYDYTTSHTLAFEFSTLSFILAKKYDYIPQIVEIFVDFLYKNDIKEPSFNFMLHKFTIATLKNAEKPKDEFDRIIRNHSMYNEISEKIKNNEEGYGKYKTVYDFIYFRASQLPINTISCVMLRDLELLDKNVYPKSFLNAFNKYKISYYAQVDLPFLMAMVQFMFSFTELKDEFLKMIESKFSIYEPINFESKSERLFCFINLISALIFDDPKLIGKKKRIVQLILMTVLKNNPDLPTNYLTFYAGPTNLNRAMKWYKEVKFENNWHIILPFLSPNDLLKTRLPGILSQMTIKPSKNDRNVMEANKDKNKNKNKVIDDSNQVLLPFPDFSDSEIIDLRSMMKCPFMYSIMYDILYDTNEPLLIHYVLNLFILFYNNEPQKNSKNNDQHLDAYSVSEMSSQISSNFAEFCETKINYRRGGSYLSFIDLIDSLGALGMNALNRVHYKRNDQELKEKSEVKSHIENIKNNILSKFRRSALKFDYSTVNNLLTDVKIKPNDKMFIYVEFSYTTIPDFLEDQYHFDFTVKNKDDSDDDDDEDEDENEVMFPFMTKRTHLKELPVINTCGHFTTEYSNNASLCPRCHLFTNFLLPNFMTTNDLHLYADYVLGFRDLFHNLKVCMKLLKTMIIVLDYRSRLKPEVLQDEMTFVLYRNLYILMVILLNGIDASLFSKQKSNLGRFLHFFIYENNCDASSFCDNFFNRFVLKGDILIDYVFLKRVELIRVFYLNRKLETIIDIDEHFSFRNLIKMYGIPRERIIPTKYTKYNFCMKRLYFYSELDEDDIDKKFGFSEEALISTEIGNFSEENQETNNENITEENQETNNENTTEENQETNNENITEENQETNNENTTEENQETNNENTTEENQEANNENITEENQETNNENTTEENQETNNENTTEENQETNNENIKEENQETNNENITEENQETNNKNITEESQETNNENITEESQETNNENITEESQETNNENITEESQETNNENITEENQETNNENITEESQEEEEGTVLDETHNSGDDEASEEESQASDDSDISRQNKAAGLDMSDSELNQIDFNIDDEELPAFRGIDLPANFLEIIRDPFNVSLVLRKGVEKIICLATGDILDRNYVRREMPIPRELTYQPVVVADGSRINATGVWRLNYFTFCEGIYRNEKGGEDVGFANGDPVFLDNERYIDLIDGFISGSLARKRQNERAEVI